MSEIKVNSIKGVGASTAAITVNNTDGSCAVNNTQRQGKNLVVNGAMTISQRGSSFSNVSNNSYTLDRFILFHTYGSTQMNVINSSQSPDGFSKSYKIDVNVADTSIGSGQYVFIAHRIEAQNLQQLSYGTSGAKSLTLSFYVRSTTTGTYALSIQQADNSSKQVSATYTINSADTWERKTFTFAGDTSGVINNDNGTGLNIYWHLAAGSNFNSGTARSAWTAYADADSAAGHTANILSSTSNNFHLTGVQLEVGDHATDFEFLSHADELRRCQRYFARIPNQDASSGYAFLAQAAAHDTNSCLCTIPFPVFMRTNPSMSTPGSLRLYDGGGITISSLILNSATVACATLQISSSSGIERYRALSLGQNNDPDSAIDFYAEL